MNIYNTIALHRVVKGKPKTFIDINEKTLSYILERSISIGQLISIDEANASLDTNIKKICLTFDDGFSSDYDLVFPNLKRINAVASFFIVTDWLDKPGYLTKQQVRNLSDAGMQIGSHSKSHPNFLKITPQERLVELHTSKNILEDIIGKKISSFSFPYGFCNDACIKAVFEANYSTCCTSKHGLSSPLSAVVPRNSINAHTGLSRIEKILSAGLIQQNLWKLEDIIKENMKNFLPGAYAVIRRFFSKF